MMRAIYDRVGLKGGAVCRLDRLHCQEQPRSAGYLGNADVAESKLRTIVHHRLGIDRIGDTATDDAAGRIAANAAPHVETLGLPYG